MSRVALALLVVVVAAGALEAAAAKSPPPCFGAASRDETVECHNPALDRRATPKPADALLMPASACKPGPV